MSHHLSMTKKCAVIFALVEGCSVRANSRMTGVCRGTMLGPLADVGTGRAEYHDATVRNVTSERVKVDVVC